MNVLLTMEDVRISVKTHQVASSVNVRKVDGSWILMGTHASKIKHAPHLRIHPKVVQRLARSRKTPMEYSAGEQVVTIQGLKQPQRSNGRLFLP